MSSDVEWRWADPTGQQRVVREDELRAALAGGMIPPNAPVWKDGWKEWQPAYSVPELTTSALAAANGVVPNIPPPPLGVLGAQIGLEKEGAALELGGPKPGAKAVPPPPPRYVPAETRPSAIPPAPGSSRRAVDAAAAAAASPSKGLVLPPSSDKASVADESNTGVKMRPLTEQKAAQVLDGKDKVDKKDEKKATKALPTAIGVPALPQPSGAPAAITTSVSQTPPRTSNGPPPLPPKGSRPPPPPPAAAKKNKTLIMYGGAPTNIPTPSSERQAPPINVPGPGGGESPQAITRPPPADGAAQVSSPPPKPASDPSPVREIEEVSGSILLEDRESSDSVVLSDSVRKVSSTLPPKPAPGAPVRTGTLLGFPVPTAAAASDAPASEPVPPAAGAGAPVTEPRPRSASLSSEAPGTAESPIVHDLRELLKRPRPKYFWPALGAGGAFVFLGLLGLLVGAVRGKPNEETKPSTTTTVSSAPPKDTPNNLETPKVDTTASPPAVTPKAARAGASGDACALAGTSHTIAPRALVPTGLEVQPSAAAIGLGFATTPKDAMSVDVDPGSLTVGASARVHAADLLKRVVPETVGGKLGVVGETDRHTDRIVGRRTIPGPWPVDVGVAEGNIVWAPHQKDAYSKLWPLDGDAPVEALRGVPIEVKGEKGFAIAFRKAGAIWMGAALGAQTLTPRGPLFRIMGLGPVVGSPTIAASGDSILIAWADRGAATDPWGLRSAKFTPGEAPRDAVAFPTPSGGLGEHAMSPWLAAVGAGRFLFIWTEGPVSGHQVRAQTLTLEGAPLGDPFTVSADGVNAGQAQGAVLADGRGVIAFLASKGKAYEVVATPIVCPPGK